LTANPNSDSLHLSTEGAVSDLLHDFMTGRRPDRLAGRYFWIMFWRLLLPFTIVGWFYL
jgi:hypothetical protein